MGLKGNISTDHRTFSGNIPGTLVFHYLSPDETVEIRVLQTDEGVLMTTKDKNGTTSAMISNGKDGHTPVKGQDYYTEADKKEMVNAVIAALPVYYGEVIT